MTTLSRTLDLPLLGLSSGEGLRLEGELQVAGIGAAGQDYEAVDPGPVRLDVSRTTAGWAFRLRFDVGMRGPCTRCLADATRRVAVDAREVDHPGETDEELTSPYVTDEVLDVAQWEHDALILAMPERFLCREDCAGLCPVCGESLNDADPADHEHERPLDPRFAKLRELKLE